MSDRNEELTAINADENCVDSHIHYSDLASNYYRYETFGDFLVTTLYSLQQENSSGDFLTAAQRETLDQAAVESIAKASCFDIIRNESNESAVKLSALFPRFGRTYLWNRFRSSAQKEGWFVPPLKQNVIIDKMVWGAFDIFMYSVITLFIFGVMIILGIHNPLGALTIYIEYLGLGIVAFYVLFLIVATGIESLCGLCSFPNNVKTVEQLQRLIIQNNVSRCTKNLNLAELFEPLNDQQATVAENLKKIIVQFLDINLDDITFETPLNQKG